jgi:hypothetical protein
MKLHSNNDFPQARNRSRRPQRRSRPQCRPTVEALETRQLLSGSPLGTNVNPEFPQNRGPVADQIIRSPEYDAGLVTADYQEFLKRAPSAAEVDSWVRVLQAGARSDQVLAAILASPEYYQRAGGTDAGWVDAVYHDLLDRSSEPVGRDYWLQALAAGAGRTAVAQRITASPEHEGRVVAADYQKLLGRTASPEEVAFVVRAFEGGLTNEQIAAGFVASDEYLLKYHGGKREGGIKQTNPDSVEFILPPPGLEYLNPTDNWLKAVYQDLLGRSPDLPGYSGWYQQLTGLAPSPDNLAKNLDFGGKLFFGQAPDASNPVRLWIATGDVDGNFQGVYVDGSGKHIPVSGQIAPSNDPHGRFSYQITFSSVGGQTERCRVRAFWRAQLAPLASH